MQEKRNMFDLANAYFSIRVSRGVLYSVMKQGDPFQTQYADEKRGFGEIRLLYEEENGTRREFCPNEQKDYQEEEPKKTGGCLRGLRYIGGAADAQLSVKTEYCLKGTKLDQRITICNHSDRAVTVLDLGIGQACHTEFRWGENAAPNVIGHHFIGGHGSHSTYYRVDGHGSCLVFAPSGQTALCYYDGMPSLLNQEDLAGKVGNEEGKRLTMLYPFAAARGKRVSQKGARLRIAQKSRLLAPGETLQEQFCYTWAEHFRKADQTFVDLGQVSAISIPGYTIPQGLEVELCLESAEEIHRLLLPGSEGSIEKERREGRKYFFRIQFATLGEHTITVEYGDGKWMHLYYFSTEAVETLWSKRAAFLASKQERSEVWYRGLFCEWNNETGVRLSPDQYDRIGGWRIYEVSCDDPGLSKPAFLSTKQTVAPVQEEITALDDYIEYFVWGGLQQTEAESYPYGIYGIPDWKKLRESTDPSTKGQLHIWRIYDYPHIALLYYNLYCVARDYPQIKTRLSAEEYLLRAYKTAVALFTIPMELEDWSAYKTGLYNERVIPWIIRELKRLGKKAEARRLETFWKRKVRYFAVECKDVFGSEYPFDTTGFESTYYLACDAVANASAIHEESPFSESIPLEKAAAFLEQQHSCNIACRGYLEPAYFWYGSDYRGDNLHYLLSYMSQMGGCSILEHALYYEEEPWEMLRLGYGSCLSSYALMNSGTQESGYGYWFPGREHDGAAGGGFEPLYEGKTWLNQPHHGGSWYYSCEIDLGFCGGIRGDCVIYAEDPLFGPVVYGGRKTEESGWIRIGRLDGAGRRFHYVRKEERVHAVLEQGQFAREAICFSTDKTTMLLYFAPHQEGNWTLTVSASGMGAWAAGEEEPSNQEERTLLLTPGQEMLVLHFHHTPSALAAEEI